MRVWRAAIGLLALLAITPISHAQAVDNTNLLKYQRELDQIQRDTALMVNPSVPVGERIQVDYGGYFTFSYLSIDDNNNHNHGLRQYDLFGYARLNIDDAQEFYIRGRESWQDFNPGDSFDGFGNQSRGTIERGYYRFDLAKAMSAYAGKKIDYDIAIQGGRQLQYWANGLALVQTLDALDIHLTYKTVDVELMGGVTPADTIDFDPTRPQYDSNTHRGFYGVMLSKQAGEHRPFVYFLSQQDYNHDYKLITGPITTRFRYDSFYLGTGSNGTLGENLNYGLEVVYEGGKSLSNSFTTAGGLSQVPQTDEGIQAFAGDFRLDYLFNDARKSRVSFETTFATGDNDRRNSTNTFGGNTTFTNDTSYNGFGQINNSLAFAPIVSNLWIVRLGGSTFPFAMKEPFKQLQSGIDLFLFSKFAERAPIDETSNTRGFLGFEPDVYVNWQIRSDITLAARYGIFFPGLALPSHQPRQFLYAGITFGF